VLTPEVGASIANTRERSIPTNPPELPLFGFYATKVSYALAQREIIAMLHYLLICYLQRKIDIRLLDKVKNYFTINTILHRL